MLFRSDAVEAATLELDHARLKQPADGLPALRAQFTILGGGTPAQGWSGWLFPWWPPGPARRGVGGAAACLLVHSKSVALRVLAAAHSGVTRRTATFPGALLPFHR